MHLHNCCTAPDMLYGCRSGTRSTWTTTLMSARARSSPAGSRAALPTLPTTALTATSRYLSPPLPLWQILVPPRELRNHSIAAMLYECVPRQLLICTVPRHYTVIRTVACYMPLIYTCAPGGAPVCSTFSALSLTHNVCLAAGGPWRAALHPVGGQ